MSSFSKETEHYIEHEVQIRLHDAKFNNIDGAIDRLDAKIDKSVDRLDNKLNMIIGIIISSVAVPVALHLLKLI